MPFLQRFLWKLPELLIAPSCRDLHPRRLVIQQHVSVFGRRGQGGVDGGSERMHQVGLGRIVQPQRAAAAAAKVALAGAGVDAFFTFALEPRVIYADVLGALDLEAMEVAAQVDGITAAALGLAADGAIAALVRVGRVAIERKANCAAMAGSFKFHVVLV